MPAVTKLELQLHCLSVVEWLLLFATALWLLPCKYCSELIKPLKNLIRGHSYHHSLLYYLQHLSQNKSHFDLVTQNAITTIIQEKRSRGLHRPEVPCKIHSFLSTTHHHCHCSPYSLHWNNPFLLPFCCAKEVEIQFRFEGTSLR